MVGNLISAGAQLGAGISDYVQARQQAKGIKSQTRLAASQSAKEWRRLLGADTARMGASGVMPSAEREQRIMAEGELEQRIIRESGRLAVSEKEKEGLSALTEGISEAAAQMAGGGVPQTELRPQAQAPDPLGSAGTFGSKKPVGYGLSLSGGGQMNSMQKANSYGLTREKSWYDSYFGGLR